MADLITEPIKKKIQQIVSVFETSSINPRYDVLVCLKDGPGGIRQVTYGKHQTTEYGNLKALVKAYCEKSTSIQAQNLKSYLDFIGDPKHPLAASETFKTLLIQAAADPVMQQTQDAFFDRYYWQPAVNFFAANIFTLPLSMAVIYDSYIHSGSVPMWLRKGFPESTPLRGGNEMEWINEYVNARDLWLEHNKSELLQFTDYRTDCWQEQVKEDNWMLEKPVVVKFNSLNEKRWITVS